MKTKIRNGLAGLLIAGAVGLGSLVGCNQVYNEKLTSSISKKIDHEDLQPYPSKILDDINSSRRMLTRDYKNQKFSIIDKDGNITMNYRSLLEDILEKPVKKEFIPPKSDDFIIDPKTGKKFVSVGTVREYFDLGEEPITIVASYDDANKNGTAEFNEIIKRSNFSLKEDKELVLGIYPPDSEKAKTASLKGTIELYNPKYEKILSDSDIKIDDELTRLRLKDLTQKNGFGVYTAAFYINNKCFEVRQINVGN